MVCFGTRRVFGSLLILAIIVGLSGCSEPSTSEADPTKISEDVKRLEQELSVAQEQLRRLEDRVSELASTGWLNNAFHSAAIRYEVPIDLLKAISFSETRWSHRSGSYPSGDRRYGVMGLRQNSTLRWAAKLLGLSEETIVTNPIENIYGGAAVLRDLWKEQHGDSRPSQNPLDWREVIKAYSDLSEEAARQSYVDNLLRLLEQGAHMTIYGEELSMGDAQK